MSVQDPIRINVRRLPSRWAPRLTRLAKRRGWIVESHAEGAAPCDLELTTRAPGDEPGESRPPGLPASHTGRLPTSEETRAPQPCRLELIEDASDMPKLGLPPATGTLGAEFTQTLLAASPEETWVQVIENAARIGRALGRQTEEIDHLRQASITDALTGIHNRSHTLGLLTNEYKRFQRSREPLSCIMIDLDHFKSINDTYGHTFGDEVLATFAMVLRLSVRESDTVGRYGGEEFLCILPDTDLEGACGVAEKLRQAIEAKVFSEGFFNIDLTASFGVSCSTLRDITNPEELLQCADRGLYRAKQTGRNRVCVAEGDESADSLAAIAQQNLPAKVSKPVILLAHPDYHSLPLYKALKTGATYEVVGMTSGDEVLAWIAKDTPTVALVHNQLPPINGWELLRRIRSRTTDSYFPIAILESASLTAIQDASYQSGADDVFFDCITINEFERRMRVFMRLKNLHERFHETYDRLTATRARLVKAKRLSALGEMASGVAHDFNNILSAILGRTEQLLHSHSEDAALVSTLSVIQMAASDGARTIKRIRDFSRSISSLDATELSLAEIVEDCIQLTRTRWKDEAEKQGIKYEVSAQVAPGLKTKANASELREVFANLIINALDSMPQGGKLELRSGPAGEERFSIEVIDTGAGMEPHVVDRIFEPFFTTKQSRGAGLGMSITYGIMSRLGGKIEVESEPGRGTTFRLWFAPPKERRADAEDPSQEGREALIDPSLTAPTASLDLLVVDDEARVRTLFADVLREEGHTVVEADCARAAMEQIKIRPFDAVITDLGMPDLTGWDVARFVKERSPETYVVLTSGWGDDFSEEYLAGKCVDHWLPKPVSLDELYSVVGSIQPIAPRTSHQLVDEA